MKKTDFILIRNAAKSDFGGGERVPVFITREAQLSGMNAVVFSRNKQLLTFARASKVQYKKTWWWSQQNWSGKRALLFPIYFLWQLVLSLYYCCLFIRFRPKIVHIQSKDDFIAATFAARLFGAKVLWSDHADLKHIFMNHSVWYKNPVGKLVYLAAHLVRRIFVVSSEDLRLISEHLPDSSVRRNMKIVYNGAFDTYSLKERYTPFTFISTARLVTDKGIGELIEAFLKFHTKHSNSQLLLLGDGPERKKFETQAASNQAIHFLGYKQSPLEYVAQSHVFILPTYHEGFSLALVEACMLQRPIITTDVGGNPEIIRDHETGILIEPRNSISLLKAMEELYSDKALRDNLAVNARKVYEEKFNFKHIIENEYLTMYKEAL